MHQPEYYTSRPNLLRVAQEIATYKNPARGVNAPASLPVPEGRTNNEKFNAILNGCQHPRAVYDAPAAFAEAGRGAQA